MQLVGGALQIVCGACGEHVRAASMIAGRRDADDDTHDRNLRRPGTKDHGAYLLVASSAQTGSRSPEALAILGTVTEMK
jgi:hypothetical protein